MSLEKAARLGRDWRRAIAASGALLLLMSGSRAAAAEPAITSALAASATEGAAFSYQITATDSPTSFDALNLPAGLSVDTNSGVISGTPASAGTSSVALSAVNADGTGTATLVLTVDPAPPAAPVITSANAASATAGSAFSYQITATNSPTSFNAAGLPAGLGIDTNSGVISGTPASAGTSSVALSASNAGGTGTETLVLTIDPAVPAAPVITSANAALATAGSAFSYQITATNSPTSFNAAGLPAGLGINTSNGVISGTPAAAGTGSVTLSAANAGGTGTAVLVLTINPPLPGAPVITSALTAAATEGAPFSYQITATNSPTSFNAVNLPPGFSVDTANGVITGTPAGPGSAGITISAVNAGGTGTALLFVTADPLASGITAALNLDGARVYPVPYRPNSGDPGAGKPFSAGDPESGVIFDNLPAAATIEIYTLSGRLTVKFGTTAGTGTLRWDARNDAGRDVASGGYFAVISSPGSKSVVKRLLIIR